MKGQLNLHKQLSFVWDETYSVFTARCALIDCYSSSLHVRHLSVSLGIPTENSEYHKNA